MLSRFVAAWFILAAGAPAAVIRVPGDQPTIQAGIDAAAKDDTVLVRSGTYSGSGNKNLDFAGIDRVLRSETGAEATVIDCEGVGRGLFFHNGESSATTVTGFTIRNGSVDPHGGGIYCFAASPTITQCTITGNSADSTGGGIYCFESSSAITQCIVADNFSGFFGSGVYGFGSSLTITECSITGNSSDGSGGGIYCKASAPGLAISECTIAGNSSKHGGGIFFHSNPSPAPLLTNSTIADNSTQFDGGGVVCHKSSPTLTQCTIQGNEAGTGGGLYFNSGSHPQVVNCSISGNVSRTNGGGIACMFSSEPNIMNCTITGNIAAIQGGGLANLRHKSPKLTNCILWGDSPNEVYNNPDYSPISDLTHCDVQGGHDGEGNIDADPLWVDPSKNDFHLTSASPAIDAGTNEGAPTVDFDGDARPQGAATDIGVDEYLEPTSCDLQVGLVDYPSTIGRGETLGFTATAANACDEARSFDTAVMQIRGPASLDKPLYSGAEFSLASGAEVGAPVSLAVPTGAPTGSYSITVVLSLAGTMIDSDAFELEVH